MNNTAESQPKPRRKLAELVGDEVGRQRTEQEQEQAYADPVEKFNPSNPGGVMARRIVQRIQQQRFEQ